MKKTMSSILWLLALAACVSSPEETSPELNVEIPRTWSSTPVQAEGGIDMWWTQFGDENLDNLVAIGLNNNYDLMAALARLDAAVARARIVGADLSPQIDGSFAASRRKQNFAGLPFSGGTGDAASTTSNSFGVSLNLSWEIDLWGRLRAAKSAALADLELSMADLEGFRLSLAGQIVKAWFASVEAREQLALAEATYENYRLTFDQIRNRYERGLRSSLELRLAESNAANAQSLVYLWQNRLQQSNRQLETLIGRYPSDTVRVSKTLVPIEDHVPAGIPADIIHRRPDLVAAERRLAASRARLEESKSALYPRISLTASGGRSSEDLDNLLDGDYTVWGLAGNLVQPIFQGGRLRAGVDLARAREDEAVAQYAQQVLKAYAEVESYLHAELFLFRQEKALQISASQAFSARDLAEERYASGLANYIALLEAQRRAFSAQSQLLSVRRQRNDTRVDLYLSLGGGFSREEIIGQENIRE